MRVLGILAAVSSNWFTCSMVSEVAGRTTSLSGRAVDFTAAQASEAPYHESCIP